MKAEADLHFLQGINQLIGHGWPYTPPGVASPGWRFYAAAVFNEQNPWWIVMPDVSKSLQRISHLLRQGQPANDVALYLPNDDAWASFKPGRVSMNAAIAAHLGSNLVRNILEAGYNLDFFDDELLALRGRVEPEGGASLTFGDVRYKAVILPDVERMPLATLQTLEQFARAGGIVIATRRMPEHAPGLKATPAEHDEVQVLAHRLFKGPDAPGTFVEDESGLAAVLQRKLAPDLACGPASPSIGYVHRHTDLGEIYFIANTGNTRRIVPRHLPALGHEQEPPSGGTRPAARSSRSRSSSDPTARSPWRSTSRLTSRACS